MRKSILTIGLCRLNLLEETLEPAEGRSVTANPEELNAAQGTKVPALLTPPDVLEDGREGRHT